MSADEPSSQPTGWRLSISSDAREALTYLVGLIGIIACLVAYLFWHIKPEPLLLGPLLVMTGVSLGAGPDRRRRERRREGKDSTP